MPSPAPRLTRTDRAETFEIMAGHALDILLIPANPDDVQAAMARTRRSSAPRRRSEPEPRGLFGWLGGGGASSRTERARVEPSDDRRRKEPPLTRAGDPAIAGLMPIPDAEGWSYLDASGRDAAALAARLSRALPGSRVARVQRGPEGTALEAYRGGARLGDPDGPEPILQRGRMTRSQRLPREIQTLLTLIDGQSAPADTMRLSLGETKSAVQPPAAADDVSLAHEPDPYPSDTEEADAPTEPEIESEPDLEPEPVAEPEPEPEPVPPRERLLDLLIATGMGPGEAEDWIHDLLSSKAKPNWVDVTQEVIEKVTFSSLPTKERAKWMNEARGIVSGLSRERRRG